MKRIIKWQERDKTQRALILLIIQAKINLVQNIIVRCLHLQKYNHKRRVELILAKGTDRNQLRTWLKRFNQLKKTPCKICHKAFSLHLLHNKGLKFQPLKEIKIRIKVYFLDSYRSNLILLMVLLLMKQTLVNKRTSIIKKMANL